MLEYIEKRNFIRMGMDCAAKIEFQGIEPIDAVVKDLSATGLSMWVDSPVPSGSMGTVSIAPGNNLTPPLRAEIEIIRCDELTGQQGVYSLACIIKDMLKTNAA